MQVHRMEDYRISHRVGRSNGTGQYFVNSRGNKKEVLAFAETYETHAGNFKPERWVEIMRECVAASGSEALLQRIIDHVKATISMYDNLDDTWKAIDGDVFCKSIMEDAMSACNLKIDRSIIKQKLGIYAAKRPDEFVAEAVSSTKNTKLEKTVKKLFKERTSE